MLGDIKKLYDEIPTTYEFKPSTTEATSQTTQINSISSFDTDYRTMLEISNEFINLKTTTQNEKNTSYTSNVFDISTYHLHRSNQM